MDPDSSPLTSQGKDTKKIGLCLAFIFIIFGGRTSAGMKVLSGKKSAYMDIINNRLTSNCDRETRIYCKSYNSFQESLKSFETNGSLMSDLDLSSLGLYLCKCIEQEINSTVVQLIRSYLGIKMPQYYCRFDKFLPRDESFVDTGRNGSSHKVYFNAYRDNNHRDILKAVPLGEAFEAMRRLLEDNPKWFRNYPVLRNAKFQETWRGITRLRNDMAHAGLVCKRERLKECYEYCLSFFKEFMPQLSDIKAELAPDGWIDEDHYIDVEPAVREIVERAPKGSITIAEEKILIARKGFYYGLVQRYSGKELTDFIYDDIQEWGDFFLFKLNGSRSYGVLNARGKEVVSCIIDSTAAFVAGLEIQSGDKHGFIDYRFGLCIQPIYDDIIFVDFDEPLIFVLDGVEGWVYKDGKFYSKDYLERMEEDDSLPYMEKYDFLVEFMDNSDW